MSKWFYSKLAAMNIRKNSKFYLPYILTCIGMVTMFYMIFSLSQNTGLDNIIGGRTIKSTLSFGATVTGIFAVIFLFYTNSFLIKRRKKEFGLYNILGMEKRHLSKIVLLETTFIAAISIGIGLLIGILLDKAMFLALINMFDFEIPFGFHIDKKVVIDTFVLFGSIFLVIFINNMRQIHFAKPIELLKGGQVGEKEPKSKLLLAVVGMLFLVAGYYISITTLNPVVAISLFFVAVVFVIIGTYFLFTAGSIVFLKLLRKNKKYYYKTKHFISVSGMMYRMKQNAVGLANICILSTMVLIMISSTLSLYIGMEDIIKTRYPRSILISNIGYSDDSIKNIKQMVNETLNSENVSINNELQYRYTYLHTMINEDYLEANSGDSLENINNTVGAYFVPLEDYNMMEGREETLNDDEILVFSNKDKYNFPTLGIFDMEFKVKQSLDDFNFNGIMATNVVNNYFVVVKDMSVIEQIYNKQMAIHGDMYSGIETYYGFDTDSDDIISIYYKLVNRDNLESHHFEGTIECREENKADFMASYGGLFFIGVFLGVLFVMATILIIYYKQISEGYDDKENFEIMQKVGMSRGEIKKSIHSQVLTVFFLPLAVAGVHVAFAFPIVTRLLEIFNLTNVNLFVMCTVGCFLVFTVMYTAVYLVTSRLYYKIVSK